jgi:hypothetical protein
MLRTRQIRRCNANGHRPRRPGTPCSSTAARLLSPLPSRHRVSRQLQLPCRSPLTTSVAKNACRDRMRLTTELATRQNSFRTGLPYSVATKRIPAQRPSRSPPTPSDQSSPFCRQNDDPRQNSSGDRIHQEPSFRVRSHRFFHIGRPRNPLLHAGDERSLELVIPNGLSGKLLRAIAAARQEPRPPGSLRHDAANEAAGDFERVADLSNAGGLE